MSLIIPYTFKGGQSAKAQEVNANFSQIAGYITDLENRYNNYGNDILELQENKANINGSPSNVFRVAQAVDGYDAVNKQYVDAQLLPVRYLLIGLDLTKTTNQAFYVSKGGCYDSNYLHPIVCSIPFGKNIIDAGAVANSTYNIFITARVSNPNVNNIILTVGDAVPTLVYNDTIYRKIGILTTDNNNNINTLVKEAY